MRRTLLACGIASSLLYALMIWAIRYEGYNLFSQVPSELTAVGAPTQRLWALLGPIYTLLVAAFGWGIWRSAGRNRAVRGCPTAVVQPSFAKLFNRQLPLWALRTFAPSTMVRMVAAVPKGFAMRSEDARFVTEFIDSLFPVSPEGVDFDAFVSNADVNDYNLEAVNVPALIVHTEDDQLASHEASKRAAERIPGARFVSLESGGHLMIGQTEVVRDELADFFGQKRDRGPRRVAS
jgi:pimeloyl-ACP methyl ester carboxylesterase